MARIVRRAPQGAFLLALLFSLGALGCGSDEATGPSAPPADVDGYLSREMPPWDAYADLQADEDVIAPGSAPIDSLIEVDGENLQCTLTDYDLVSTPTRNVVFDSGNPAFWLGALVQGDGYKGGLGSMKELPIRQRAPLTITINILSNDNTRTVPNPDAGSVGQAIGQLIQAATESGLRAGSTFSFDQTTAYSLKESSLRLGVSARFLGTDVSSSLSLAQTAGRNSLTAYFLQEMFTTSIVQPQTPGEFFSDEFTSARLQEQIDAGNVGPDNPPVYIGSITWGRMLMVTMTSTYSTTEMQAALNATRASLGGADVDATSLQVLQNSEIRVRGIGGDTDGVDALIRSGQLSQYFDVSSALTTARPISFSMYDLATSDLALVSETTRYTRSECQVEQGPITGGSYRVTFLELKVMSDGCDGVLNPAPELYYSLYVGTEAGLGGVVAQRTASQAVQVKEGNSLIINKSKSVNMYRDGRGLARVYGKAYDYDSGSADEEIGAWDITYRYGVTNGTRYFTRSNNGCSVRLYLDIQKTADLYD